MTYTFIGGIPTAGKTYLAQKLADTLGCIHVGFDELREEMKKDPKLEPWVNFYWNIDETRYWEQTNPQEHFQNLVNQSEAFWPTIIEYVKQIISSHKSVVFEGVNILPHLARKDLDFSGIFLLGESLEATFKRNQENPRWGKTKKLQQIESEWFYVHEATYLQREADKYGYLCFNDPNKAELELLKLMNN